MVVVATTTAVAVAAPAAPATALGAVVNVGAAATAAVEWGEACTKAGAAMGEPAHSKPGHQEPVWMEPGGRVGVIQTSSEQDQEMAGPANLSTRNAYADQQQRSRHG